MTELETIEILEELIDDIPNNLKDLGGVKILVSEEVFDSIDRTEEYKGVNIQVG